MKKVEIIQAFKKFDNASKDNYRPVSTLFNFTEIFESILFVWKTSSQNILQTLEKVIIRSITF